MRTSIWSLGAALALTAGCGGTVVFEEDGGGGDGGGGLSGPTTSGPTTGPGGGDGGAGNGGAGNGGAGPGPTTSVTTTSVTVGPTTTVSVVSSVSTGPGGCGSLADELQLPPPCDGCLENRCCDELLACDEGTACWDCIFFGESCNQGQPAIDALVFCIQDECNQQCNGGNCGPGEFECPENGGCIPERWVCDGFPDCPQGGDEFCGCGPGDFQCFESGECIPGEWQCDGFVDCEDGTDEQFCGCGPGDFQCFESGECIPGEWQCNGFVDCADGTDELDCPDQGICQSGLSTGDFQLDLCLENACCDAFNFCSAFGQEVDPCIDCFNAGGGPRCDEAIACADANCTGESFLITPPGEAYGHHGECSGWNACGDAATCAQWACQAEGFGTLVSFGDERPCTQWDNCRLMFDGCCNGVDYQWGNWCDVMGVGEIRCAP